MEDLEKLLMQVKERKSLEDLIGLSSNDASDNISPLRPKDQLGDEVPAPNMDVIANNVPNVDKMQQERQPASVVPELQKSVPNVVESPQEVDKVSTYQSLLAELESSNKKSDESIIKARKSDRLMDLLSGLSQAAALKDASNVGKASGTIRTPIDMKHKKSTLEADAQRDGSRRSKDLESQLGLKGKLALIEAKSKSDPKGMSEYQKEMLKLRQEGESRRSGSRSERELENDQKQVERYTKSAEGTKSFQTSQTLINKASTVRSLLDDANIHGGQSLSMLGPVVAKGIAGEVGVLTDKDVTRYVNNPSLIGGLTDTLLKLKKGKVSDVSYENLNRLVDIMESKSIDIRKTMYKRKAKQLSKNSALSYDESLSKLDPDYDPDSYKDNQYRTTSSVPKTIVLVDSKTGKELPPMLAEKAQRYLKGTRYTAKGNK